MVTARLNGTVIEVRFPYDRTMVLKVKSIPDSRWNKVKKFWALPPSPWHAEKLFQTMGDVQADRIVTQLARSMAYFRVQSKERNHNSPKDGLYEYQYAGVDYIDSCNGHALIADSTGLGKTVIALHWAKIRGMKKILVVCPATIKHKWVKEIKRWYDENASIELVEGSVFPWKDILVMSYDRMRRLSEDLTKRHFDLMILDEIQAIKNPKSQRGAAARKIAGSCTNVIGLSATPMPNRPIEFFNQLHTIRPWEYTSSWSFGARYAGGDYAHSNFKGASNIGELRDRLTSIAIRRRKNDVLEQLPDLTRSIAWVDLEGDDAFFYSQVKSEVKRALMELNPSHKGYFANALDQITALRQAVGTAKATNVADFINTFMEGSDEDAKVVVSCHFMKTIESITSRLEVPYLVMTGKDSTDSRARKVDEFRSKGGPRILIMSSVGSEGIDLFGLDGVDISDIILVDRQWNPAAEEQAEGRLHRIGQDYPVTAHYILANDTLDEYMTNIVETKRRLGDTAVKQGEIVKELVKGILSDD